MGIWDRDYMHERWKDQLNAKPSRTVRRGPSSGGRWIERARWLAVIGSCLGALVYTGRHQIKPAEAPAVEHGVVRAVEPANAKQQPDSAPVNIDFFRPLPRKSAE